MYGILLVSEDEGFRSMAPRFMPRTDHHADVHVTNGPEAALLALGSDGSIGDVVFDHRLPGDTERSMAMLGRSRVDRPLVVVSGVHRVRSHQHLGQMDPAGGVLVT